MPFKFDPKNFQNKANALLSTRYGGNLIQKSNRLPQNQVCVFIGLGGLGCRAVNAIKAISNEKLENPDRRLFLCLDTSKKDFDDISVATEKDIEVGGEAKESVHGSIENDEKCVLFPGNPVVVKTLGSGVNSWLDVSQFGEKVLDSTGANGIRQMGRLALYMHYDQTYNKIVAVIQKALQIHEGLPDNDRITGKIKVYMIAGISGGTGSGTIVDAAFMLRKAMQGKGLQFFHLEGVLFTPDVQENDKGIRGEDDRHKAIRENHKRNFYAAIKEIDYFYNNIARKKKYESLIGDKSDAYKQDIFDACTLISRYAVDSEIANDSDGVVKKLANALTYEISAAKAQPTAETPPQTLSSYMDNIDTHVNGWLWGGGAKRMGIPEWAPPRYSTLGYSSFYVPRDELLAYCANLLMEKLIKDWNEKILPRDKMDQFMSRYGLLSLRQFAAKLFELDECAQFFDVPHRNMPSDPTIGRVRNCVSYLDEMKETALDEGQEVNADEHVRHAAEKLDSVIVDPIYNHVANAFFDPKLGPAYASHLIFLHDASNPGVIQRLASMLADLDAAAKAWLNELATAYNALYKKATELEELTSVDRGELESFTSSCRDYGEKLLQAKLLSRAYEALKDVYDKICRKNETVFQVYTVTFKYLCEMLAADSAYVADPQRHKAGSTTTFSFSVANFDRNDPITAKFKKLFEGLVEAKDLANEAASFVTEIFGGIKKFLQPAPNDTTEYTEEDVIGVINGYFKKAFPLWTTDVIQRFCVIAYSGLEITPAMLNTIWTDPTKAGVRDTALTNTAGTIITALESPSRPMLSMMDTNLVITEFPGYDVTMALPETKDINEKISGRGEYCSPLDNGWSEFIRFRRLVGIPFSFIKSIDECQKLYAGAPAAGFHLDEVGDNWRANLPEPYGYNMRRRMDAYRDNGSDQTEFDRCRMREILALAKKAKAIGILEQVNQNVEHVTNAMKNDQQTDGTAEKRETITVSIVYYALTYSFERTVDLSTLDARNVMYAAVERVVLDNMRNECPNEMLSVLQAAGYPLKEAVEIRWTFPNPQYNSIMPDCTSFGNDLDFGNFVTLIRSNYDWYLKLKSAVALFAEVRKIYDKAIAAQDAIMRWEERLKGANAFIDAIRVGRITPHVKDGFFDGYAFVTGEKIEADGRTTPVFDYSLTDGFHKFDETFSLYHAFAGKYYAYDDNVFGAMRRIVEHDLSTDVHAERTKAARENVNWFIDHVRTLLNSPMYFVHYDDKVLADNFSSGLSDSQCSYSLPVSSKNNKDVAVVRSNLKGFYEYVLRKLVENKIPDNMPYPGEKTDPAPQEPEEPQKSDALWDCPNCGKKGLSGKFCPNCGSQPPKPVILWDCPNCGKKGLDGKFCPNCGSQPPKPVILWDCPNCGKKGLDGKFCPNCGSQPPKPAILWDCPNCGKKGIDGLFCPECGSKRNS